MGIKLSSLRFGAAAVFLPSDVVFEILSRTPVKSLCRFRCVCKQWRALISDPAFVAAHGRNHAGTPPLLLVASSCEPALRLVDMNGRVVKVIDHLNYLPPMMPICSSTPDHVVCAITYFNTAKVIDLVAGKVLLRVLLKGTIYGFGRAAPSGVHKLLCLGEHICEVITVGGGEEEEGGAIEWRQKPSPPGNYTLSSYADTAALNGTLHVVAEEDGDWWEGERLAAAIVVLRFDLESEVWKKAIKGPADLQRTPGTWGYTADLCELNDALCMVHVTTYGRTTDVWLLTDAGDGDGGGVWSKVYAVRCGPSVSHFVMPLREVPSDDDDGGKLLLFYYIFGHGRRSVPQLYDPRDGTCTNAMKMPGDQTEVIGLCTLPLERLVSAKPKPSMSSIN